MAVLRSSVEVSVSFNCKFDFLDNFVINLIFDLQLADAKDVMKAIKDVEVARLPVLTPNLKVSLVDKNLNLIIYLLGHYQ